jgi:uncharacterized membrane protein
MPLGEILADKVAKTVGSWKFIMIQSFLLACWILVNIFTPFKFDPYPFIFLNLALSFQAAYTAPILMMSSNRQEALDRERMINILEMESDDHNNIDLLLKHLDDHFHLLNARIDKLESSEPLSPNPSI